MEMELTTPLWLLPLIKLEYKVTTLPILTSLTLKDGGLET
jgi:hypothetical protein